MNEPTKFSVANKAFREGDLCGAFVAYLWCLCLKDTEITQIQFNLWMVRKKLSKRNLDLFQKDQSSNAVVHIVEKNFKKVNSDKLKKSPCKDFYVESPKGRLDDEIFLHILTQVESKNGIEFFDKKNVEKVIRGIFNLPAKVIKINSFDVGVVMGALFYRLIWGASVVVDERLAIDVENVEKYGIVNYFIDCVAKTWGRNPSVNFQKNEYDGYKKLLLVIFNYLNYCDHKNEIIKEINLLSQFSHKETCFLIEKSQLFDYEYYVDRYPDVVAAGLIPIDHFVMYGAIEGRRPSKYFDPEFYVLDNARYCRENENPLLHYILIGSKYNAKPSKSFDPIYYLDRNPEAGFNYITPLTHYLNQSSDGKVYKNKNEELQANLIRKDEYQSWREYNVLNGVGANLKENIIKTIATLEKPPKISVIMPVFRPPINYLRKAIESVKAQIYPYWELCIADDFSECDELTVYLAAESELDRRIKIVSRSNNGHISACTNSAVTIATGEYLAFLDQDDELSIDALFEVAQSAVSNFLPDVIYSDDDKISENGEHFAPQFKPSWSPELLLSFMYFSHLFVVKRELYLNLGGMRVGLEGAQDYDFALRVTEITSSVIHIPKILYHWRVLPGSTAMSGKEKTYSFDAGLRATTDATKRRGIKAKSYRQDWAVKNGNGIFSYKFENAGPSVALIIPTKDQAIILSRLLITLSNTSYKCYNIYIIDNESKEQETFELFEKFKCNVLKIPNLNGKFNFAHINNKAVEYISEEFVLFLNNDVEILESDWLTSMMGWAQLDGVGAVGVRLLYSDRTVQHGGVLNHVHDGLPGHAFKHLPEYDAGYLSFARVVRNCTAVTAACLLMRRCDFLEIGGFDEVNFGVAYNDVDLCYKIINKNKRIVYAGDVTLLHHEGKSRGYSDDIQEEITFAKKYKNFEDSFLNRNIDCNEVTNYGLKGGLVSDLNIDLRGRRVLFYSHNLNYEGAPIQLLEIAQGLKKKFGIIPIFVSPVGGGLESWLNDSNIEYRILSISDVVGLKDCYEEGINKLTNILFDVNVQCAFTNTILGFWVVDVFSKLNIPVSWLVHESEPPFQHIDEWESDAQIAARRALGCAYNVIFVSRATKNLYLSLSLKNNYKVIHNGLSEESLSHRFPMTRDEARRILNLTIDDVYVINVGTVCERKGQLDFIKAINNLSNQALSRIHVAVVGDRHSPYSSSMHELIDTLPNAIRRRLNVVPETRDVGLYFMAADIFVCSSSVESYPRVIQEAMYCGLAIVTTPVFGIVEQVKNNLNAMFYAVGNISDLTDKLEVLIVDKSTRERLSKNAILGLERLNSYAEMVDEYGELVKEMCIYSEIVNEFLMAK